MEIQSRPGPRPVQESGRFASSASRKTVAWIVVLKKLALLREHRRRGLSFVSIISEVLSRPTVLLQLRFQQAWVEEFKMGASGIRGNMWDPRARPRYVLYKRERTEMTGYK